MNTISAAELASIQADAAATLDKSCEIQRKTTTKDKYGGQTVVWNTVSPDGLMAGLSQPTAGQLQNYAYMIASQASWQVHLPVGTDVQHQDRLIIDGQTLEVQVLLNPRSYAALLTVLASELK